MCSSMRRWSVGGSSTTPVVSLSDQPAELARGELEASRVDWRKDAWKANRVAARRSLVEPQD